MNYSFPRIERLRDVLPAIEGRPEFVVAEREHYTVVNYMVAMADTFPEVDDVDAAIRRECRGLLFYPDGRIMARRLHKFFNVNERAETSYESVDFSQLHVILEKLDGSMITPVMTSTGIRWGTKMGITGVAMGAEEFVAKQPKYADFARGMLSRGFTPIFEWCSRKQRIVIDYPEDRLVLIAIRNTITGEYVSHERMLEYHNHHGIDVVKAYSGTASSMTHLLEETKGAEGIEGWIVRFNDGHMVKVKGDWYVRIHRVKDAISSEKNVVAMIVDGNMDDAKPLMLEADRLRVEAFEDKFWEGFLLSVSRYEEYFYELTRLKGVDRKDFALDHAPKMRETDHFGPSIIFSMYNEVEARSISQILLDVVRKNMNTGAKIDTVRYLWGDHRWDYAFTEG